MKTVLVSGNPLEIKTDLLVAGFFEKGTLPKIFQTLDPEFARLAKLAVEKKRFQGKSGDFFSIYRGDNAPALEIALVGLGPRKGYGKTALQKAVSGVTQFVKKRAVSRVHLLLESFSGGPVGFAGAAGAIAEAMCLADYEFKRYKTSPNDEEKKTDPVFGVFCEEKRFAVAAGKALDEARFIAGGNLLARDLVNEPANVLHAREFVSRVRSMAEKKNIRMEVLEAADLKKLKMGGILAVNQGSPNPPAMVILETGESHKKKGTLCLVGKGVTFDTGGISIKPAKDMDKMKYDMAGAAAVVGIMNAAADLAMPHHLVALAPLVENNVAEHPQRPGDIIRMHNGKTVEVLNTDAEGRLILADALSYSAKYDPRAIIDLATLTGMCAYTFADKAIGLLGNDRRLIERIKRAGELSGERCWELPLWEEYGEMIKGNHSDLCNIGGAMAGTITAAMFLKEFVPGKTPWAHLDIAGTAWCEQARYDAAKGATGVGVRLILALLKSWK